MLPFVIHVDACAQVNASRDTRERDECKYARSERRGICKIGVQEGQRRGREREREERGRKERHKSAALEQHLRIINYRDSAKEKGWRDIFRGVRTTEHQQIFRN